MLSHDSRLRCSFVDLYYVLYGTRRPLCIPVPELATILNVKHERNISPMQDKEVSKHLTFPPNCYQTWHQIKTGSVFFVSPGDDSCCSPSASVSPVTQDLFYRNSNSVSYVTYTNYTEVKVYGIEMTVISSFCVFYLKLFIWCKWNWYCASVPNIVNWI